MISIKHWIALSSTYRRTEHPDHKGSSSHPGGKGYQGNGFGSHPDASGFLKYCIVKACFLGVLMLFVWGRWCFCRQALPYVKVLPYYVKVTKETGLGAILLLLPSALLQAQHSLCKYVFIRCVIVYAVRCQCVTETVWTSIKQRLNGLKELNIYWSFAKYLLVLDCLFIDWKACTKRYT